MAAIPAYLYCASAAKYDGFLVPLLLDAAVLERNFQQMLYSGFFVFLWPALYAITGYVICRFLYSHFLLPEINDELRKSWRRKRQFLKLKQFFYGKRKDSKIEQREKQRSAAAGSILLIFVVLILTFVYFENKGKQDAISILNKINEKSYDDHELITVTLNGKLKKLLYLTCGIRNCAGIDPITSEVHYFPQNGHSFFLPIKNSKQQAVEAEESK